MIKRLAYTPGEPAGIGPDLAIIRAHHHTNLNHQLVVFADPDLMLARAQQLNLTIDLKTIDLSTPAVASKAGELAIVPIASNTKTIAGQLDATNAPYVLNTLDAAINACMDQSCHGMVTGPVQKSIINQAGIAFSGHTEYLAEKTNTPLVVMMLATEGLRVALATTHIPLAKVASAITQAHLCKIIRILHKDLQQKFTIDQPTILVCGLNPHAGEDGHLGREEIDIIIPALKTLADENIHCHGPLPADTLFTPKHLAKADAVLAMYHDQGLPVLKYKGFGAAVNITLGLPIIRTSVDHGTALDLAGSGNIDTGSLDTAIHYALTMNTTSL